MTLFNGNFNSEYHKAMNVDDTQRSYTRVTAYVESEYDVPFWYMIFKKFLPGREVLINPSTKGDSVRGKEAVLALKDGAGEYLLLCVDSDYDYLIQDANENARAINESKYIFQTYTYSIENYKCVAHSLDYICVDATYNAEVKFDFVQFLQEYSNIIYKLFLYLIYSVRNNINKVITTKKFCECARLDNTPNIDKNAQEPLQKLQRKIERIIEETNTANPEINLENEIESLGSDLIRLGVTHDNVYLFINGHLLFDHVVGPIMRQVTDKLKSQKHNEISNYKAGNESRRGWYKNNVCDYRIPLKFNKDFLNCPLVDKIRQDIQLYRNSWDSQSHVSIISNQ